VKDLENTPRLAYSTPQGRAYQGDSRALLSSGAVSSGSVDLIFTSPPFALTRQKDYGNKSHDKYLDWFETFVPGWQEMLSATGSLVIDVGGAYLPGAPRRSTYHFELAVRLGKHFDLCQEFYWYNPAKLPGPAQWTNMDRVRVKDSVNLVLWFAKDASIAEADNRRVLKRYSESMKALLKNGYQVRKRPSNHDISSKFLLDNGGAIPSNVLGFVTEQGETEVEGIAFESMFDNLIAISNTSSNDKYLELCRRHDVKPHNARFPRGLPGFFIEFLTRPGQVVLDPFAGSNTTGEVAEALQREWISCELDAEGEYAGTYVRSSAFRFDQARFEPGFDEMPAKTWRSLPTRVRPVAG
jgi:hypothetical protein